MYKYAKFDQNIPRGSRIVSVFSKWPRPAGGMLGKASSIKIGCYTCEWLDNVDMYKYA